MLPFSASLLARTCSGALVLSHILINSCRAGGWPPRADSLYQRPASSRSDLTPQP